MSSKEGRGGLKKVICAIGIFVGVIVLGIGGVVTAFTGFIFGGEGDDIYNLAKEAVKSRYAIENNLDVTVLKLIGIVSNDEIMEDQKQIEKYIEQYFIIDETMEISVEESSEPEESIESEETSEPEEEPEPEVITFTRFKTLDEIFDMLQEEPFNLTDENIEYIRELMQNSTEVQEGDYTGDGTLQWPVPSVKTISSAFGYRYHPITGKWKMHSGVDIPAKTGTAIVSSDAGTVIFAGYDNGGYGYLVKIDHGNGMQTWYAHNSKLQVSVGNQVDKGQQIALSGATGNVTGAHLHFEVHINGKAFDPMIYLEG